MKTQGKQAAAMIAAEEQGYSVIEITQGMNGYPEWLGDYAVIGFQTWDDAQQFADTYGGDINLYHRRTGWHLWENLGRVWEPFTPNDFIQKFSDNYNIETNDPEQVADRLKSLADSFEGDMDKLKSQLAEISELWEKVEQAPEEYAVVSYCGAYFDTLHPLSMWICHDTHHWSIGVSIENQPTE
jgi:hypothetical protein